MKRPIPLLLVALILLLLSVIAFTGTVTASYGSSVVSNTVPATVTLGQSYSVSITMHDTSQPVPSATKQAWPSTVKLLISGYMSKIIPFSSATKVMKAPFVYWKFPFSLRLTDGGTQTITAQMILASGTKFGAVATIKVNGVGDWGKMTSMSIPDNMYAKKTYTVSFTFKNTGTTTWTKAAGYYLLYSSTKIYPTTSVAPGASYTFKIQINVQTPGTKSLCVQLYHGSKTISDQACGTMKFQ
jgi:hypothetical protein